MSFGARALIRLGALSHNLSVIKQAAPDAAVMAVVKANAYGHGLVIVAEALADADSLAVARLSEAQVLRDAGIEKPVVILSGVYCAAELQRSSAMVCELVVHCEAQIELLEANPDYAVTVWLKLDTGMNRLGFPIAEADVLMQRLNACAAVRELRLMTHLANADDTNDPKTDAQLQQFAAVTGSFSGDISIANSGGIFGWSRAVKPDNLSSTSRVWIRPGIALYGVSPFPEKNGSELGLQPVMRFESTLISVKPIAAGATVGYGGEWAAERDTALGIVSAGYGDGYTRYLPSGTPVFVNGRAVPLVGVVSMDSAAVDLGPSSGDSVGDIVELWGDAIPVEEVARKAGTTAYQLVCGVMNREASSVISS